MKQKLLTKLLAVMLVAESVFQFVGPLQVTAAGEEIPIDEAHFPDPGFRSVISRTCDTDGNGALNDTERGVYNVYCRNEPNVRSIEGIEYFPDVKGVWCDDCNITGKLDFTKNPAITGIWCSGNPVTEIDLSGCPNLEWIYCFQCDLTELDLSNNPKMGYLEISENPRLTSIDLSVCPDLEHLIIFGCPLESLDLTHNTKLTHLDAQNTGLKHLNLGNNPSMKRLDVWGNHGLEVDVSGLSGLEFFCCADTGITHLDVSHNPQLMALICDWNKLTELDLSHNPRLCDLRCGCNNLTKLDVSHNPLLYYFQIFGNPLDSVNINNNSRLRYILDQVEKGNGTMIYDPGSQSNDYLVDFGGDHEYMDELRYFISVKPSTQLIADNPNEAADVPEIYLNIKDGLSDSEDFVTRGEAIQTMYELAGSPAVSGSSRFTDVAGTFYEKAVIWGEQNNICYGYPNLCSDTFNGGMAIARQDFALMVHHYAEGVKWLSAFDYGRTDDKTDFFEVDYYAWGAVTYAIQWEILETKNNHIYPHGRITTAEMQKGLKEFLDHVEKHATINVSTQGGSGTFENTGYVPVIPSNPGGNNEPDVNPTTPGGNNEPDVNPTTPGGNNEPDVNPTTPGGNNEPDVNPTTPGGNNNTDVTPSNPGNNNGTGGRPSTTVHTRPVSNSSEGLRQGPDGEYYYYRNDVVATDINGFVEHDGYLFFLVKGKVDKDADGLVQDIVYTDDWYFCADGQAQNQYTGLAEYDGAWFYVRKGKLDTKMAGFVEYDGALFFVGAGRIMKEVSGLAQDPNGSDWYYLANGQAQTQYTGLAEYDGEWFYVKDGKLASDYTGRVSYDGASFYVKNGMVQ